MCRKKKIGESKFSKKASEGPELIRHGMDVVLFIPGTLNRFFF